MTLPEFTAAMRHYQAGRLAEADAICASLPADHAEALHLRGVIAHQRGQHEAAWQMISQAVALDGRNPSFHHNRGTVAQALGRTEAAAACFEAVLHLRPDAAEAHFCLGNLLQQQGRLDEAAVRYRRAIALQPRHAAAHNNLALTLMELGQLPDAAEAAEQAIRLTPGRGKYYRNLAETRRFTAGDPHIATMEQLLGRQPPLPPEEQITLHFALGKAYADVADAPRSFDHLRRGNALHRARIRYDEAGTLGLFRRIAAACPAAMMQAPPRPAEPSGVPVFILGMPRSGTTLVEQILASHPQVHGGGEREEFGQAVAALGFPESVAALSDAALLSLGRDYTAALRALAPGAARVTDKMPRNFLFVGLIRLALPNARIIHVRRDPVDTCLSCFSRLFIGQHPYSYDLGELGRYWRGYDGLMAHWRAVLPAGAMLEVRYEDVVADLEGQARRMVAHCGLAWDAACLAFHETERVVRTASAAQVRQKLYGGAVGRARGYGALLEPLLRELPGDAVGAR